MLTLNTETLDPRDTNAGRDFAGLEVKPVWVEKNVLIAYRNACGQEIVDSFEVSAKALPEGVLVNASGLTTLQFWAPADWVTRAVVPFTEDAGQLNRLPIAGLASRPFILDTAALQVTHLDILGDDYDEL